MFNTMNYNQALGSFIMQVLQSNGASILVTDIKNRAHLIFPQCEDDCTFGPPPADGYMVSLKNGMTIDLSEIHRSVDADGIKKMFNALLVRCNMLQLCFPELKGNLYLGAWIDEANMFEDAEGQSSNGTLIGDVSINVSQLHVAVALGLANDQRAIYDVKNKESIYIK